MIEVTVPKFLEEINDRCKSGWLVGNKISLADFWVGGLYTNWMNSQHAAYGKDQWPELLAKYPNFKAYGERYSKEISKHL